MKYSTLVERWLPLQQIPSAVQPVTDSLRGQGINVCRVGIENPKAPSIYVFVDRPFDAKAVLAGLPTSLGLSVHHEISGIHSREYVWVGFEEGICERPE